MNNLVETQEINNIFKEIVEKYKPFNDEDLRKYNHTKEVVDLAQNLAKCINVLICHIIKN